VRAGLAYFQIFYPIKKPSLGVGDLYIFTGMNVNIFFVHFPNLPFFIQSFRNLLLTFP
jgi:hypothetical protein